MLRMLKFLNSIFRIKHLTIHIFYICSTEFKYEPLSLSHTSSLKTQFIGYFLPEAVNSQYWKSLRVKFTSS